MPEEHPFVGPLVRYGIPSLILVFYISASLHFNFTPDSTFAALHALNHTGVDSLWSLLLRSATLFNLDALLAAKVFSLLFACFTILVSYLIANEVLRDHLLAFCVALMVSMQAWLLQLAPSGSGLCCALFLVLATIFFLLRNEYIIGAFCAGLASLVAWQAAGLLVVLAVDALINSVSKNRSVKIIASIVLVFFGVVLPWMLYSLYVGKLLLPNEVAITEVPTVLPHVAFETVLLVGLMFVGVVLLATRDREALRSQTAVVLWIVAASYSHQRMFVLSLPLIIVYAVLATRKVVEIFGKPHFGHLLVGILTAAILAYNQFVVHPVTKQLMEDTIADAEKLRTVEIGRAHV